MLNGFSKLLRGPTFFSERKKLILFGYSDAYELHIAVVPSVLQSSDIINSKV